MRKRVDHFRSGSNGKVSKKPMEVTCPLGHKFTMEKVEPNKSPHPWDTVDEGWTPSDVGKVVRLRTLGYKEGRSPPQYDFLHGFFLVCPKCGIVFKKK